MNEILLMAHGFFGVTCILASGWVFVDTLKDGAKPASAGRTTRISLVAAVAMWLAFVIGGYWHVVFYAADKTVILKGPWPLAHSYFMETKEHLVIMLLLLATYLPIAASCSGSPP